MRRAGHPSIDQEGRMMLTSLLVRLSMMALTMAVVCWMGWAAPASQSPGSSLASGPVEQEHPTVVSPPSTASDVPPIPERREKLSRPPGTILDVNHATEQDLQRLPGIGPVLAGRIVEYRQTRGAFETIDQLRRVKGIGKKKFEQFRSLLRVVPPSASRPARKTA
jgi:competence protein ComEA